MEKIVRTACRALVVSPENEILLVRLESPTSPWKGWIVPGGGIASGESDEQALRRELREELGLKKFMFEGPVWTRFHAFEWNGKWIEQSERFFLVLMKKFEPAPELPFDETEIEDIKGYRWWRIDEIDRSGETFAPRDLGNHLNQLLKHGIPDRPIDVSDSRS